MIFPRLKDAELSRRLRMCALELYERQGYEPTTSDEIAHAAGISRSTLFTHYPVAIDVLFSDHFVSNLPALRAGLAADGNALEVAVAALSRVLNSLGSERDFLQRRALVVDGSLPLRDREGLWNSQFIDALTAHFLPYFHAEGMRGDLASRALAASSFTAFNSSLGAWIAGERPRPDDLFALTLAPVVNRLGRRLKTLEPSLARAVVVATDLSEQQIREALQ